jgi:transposase
MTSKELVAALERAGMTQAELATRLGVTLRYVQRWVAAGVPGKWAARSVAAIRTRPRILLNRAERIRVAELLDKITDPTTPWNQGDQRDSKRLRDKIKASVGGVMAD